MFGLRGYIDESHDPAPIPKIFNLTCLVGYDNFLPWFELAWVKVIEEKNEELTKAGRPAISRYHASDCSNLKGEFRHWTIEEQIEFSQKLFSVFRKHPVHIHSFDLSLQVLVQEIPEAASNPTGLAYVLLLRMLMDQISALTLSIYPNDKIELHHDQCGYDAALAEAFKTFVKDPSLKRANNFVSIKAEPWQSSVMLQAADLIAYENFKESMRNSQGTGKSRRKSLNALLDLDSLSGRASGLQLDAIKELKVYIDSLDDQSRKNLFALARLGFASGG
jgi:hypothetical protein